MKTTLKSSLRLLACVATLSATVESRAALQEYAVTINTAALAASPLSANGPFSLDFQLNSGGYGLGNNAIINNFTFGGGAAAGAPVANGTAAGSMSSAITLSDNNVNGFNELYQGFTPGTSVSFDVLLSANPTGLVPDGLDIAILDNTLGQIVTTDPNDGLSLVTFSIGSFGKITPQIYSGINNTDPANLVDLGDYSSVVASVVPVPEPSTLAAGLCALGTVLAGLTLRRKSVATV